MKAGEFVFPGQARNKPLSLKAMELVLRRMKVEDATVHGFRSSFRDWAGNVSNFPREKSPRRRWRMSLVIRQNKLTGGVTRWRSGAS
jgi:hypothetical protein